ncbi:MAG: mechanosensitive ion channel family protein [Bacteroidales bacterium]|nr:mechanosensitive ion channel family protein [Bacteroidales bacterium]
MKLLQDPITSLAMGAGVNTPPADTAIMPKTEFDSVRQTVKDSLQNMDAHQMLDVLTGKNTLLRDATSSLIEMTMSFIPKLLVAILILWLGFKLSRVLKRSLVKLLERRGAEASLKTFLGSFIDVLLKILIVIMAMDVIGIKATSFIAVLGALGLAVGMALQGTLQNFAGGVIILLLKPFKVGDYIECGGIKGYVREIRIFHTIIQPFNARTIVVPNSELSNKSLINHTKEPRIRLDVKANVAYGTDLKKAQALLMDLMMNDPLIEKEPKKPAVFVSGLLDSSVELTLWIWATIENYWTVAGYINERIYDTFNENDIQIPFPQIHVHTDK